MCMYVYMYIGMKRKMSEDHVVWKVNSKKRLCLLIILILALLMTSNMGSCSLAG